jgi:hypothetical protein
MLELDEPSTHEFSSTPLFWFGRIVPFALILVGIPLYLTAFQGMRF